MGQMKSEVKTLSFRRVNLQLIKSLAAGSPWETTLRTKGAEQRWQLFKDIFLCMQELLIHLCKKLGKEGKRPAWLSNS